METQNSTDLVQTPLHRRIAETLGSQVSSGALKPGQKLPSERQIARQFNASRATVRTALQHLEQAGIISRRERRSAVVTIRRDIAPYLRIACGDAGLTRLFNRLSDMQVLPPRCQIQLFDLQQAGAVTHLTTQPTVGVDLLFCNLEFARCFTGEPETNVPERFPTWLIDENQLTSPLHDLVVANRRYQTVPLTITPMVLYYSRAAFRDSHVDVPHANWTLSDITRAAQALSRPNRYGLQFRPSFAHLSSVMAAGGTQLYQANGKLAAESGQFESMIRLLYGLLHQDRCAPLLARAEQINLFGENRCAMAIDGFDMYRTYRDAVGDDLGVIAMPIARDAQPLVCGMMGIVLAAEEEQQPVHDLLRTLLGANSQRMMTEMSAGLPVRSDLLSMEAMQQLGVDAEIAQTFLNRLQRCGVNHLPMPLEHKQDVESLFLELWLGLDTLDSICQRFRQLA